MTKAITCEVHQGSCVRSSKDHVCLNVLTWLGSHFLHALLPKKGSDHSHSVPNFTIILQSAKDFQLGKTVLDCIQILSLTSQCGNFVKEILNTSNTHCWCWTCLQVLILSIPQVVSLDPRPSLESFTLLQGKAC